MTTHLKNAFEGRSFPSIQTVILPTHAHEIMRCCKKATTVICNYGDGSQIVTAIAKGNKKVERLEGFSPDENLMKRWSFSNKISVLRLILISLTAGIVKAVPNLRTIKFNGPITPVRCIANQISCFVSDTCLLAGHSSNHIIIEGYLFH
jgi:hypothetical protein